MFKYNLNNLFFYIIYLFFVDRIQFGKTLKKPIIPTVFYLFLFWNCFIWTTWMHFSGRLSATAAIFLTIIKMNWIVFLNWKIYLVIKEVILWTHGRNTSVRILLENINFCLSRHVKYLASYSSVQTSHQEWLNFFLHLLLNCVIEGSIYLKLFLKVFLYC